MFCVKRESYIFEEIGTHYIYEIYLQVQIEWIPFNYQRL